MKTITVFLIAMAMWYGIFSFVTGTLNPLEWGTFTRVLAVIVFFIVAAKAEDFD